MRRTGWMTGMAVLVALGGCRAQADDRGDAERAEAPAVPAAAAPAPPAGPADSAAARARIRAAGDSLRGRLSRVPVLAPREVAELRFDVNATQIASARRLGARVSGEAERDRRVREGRLVALDDSTGHWILRRMEHSSAHVTPDARAMLQELGRRFHARLDSAGLPRYRMRITSALRTDEDQAALRRINRNASSIVSAHEFGTTVDVSHEQFAVPAERWPDEAGRVMPELAVEVLEEAGKENSRALQAALGRAIWEMREAGLLHVMMEDAQPVYHMTVARDFAER